MDFCPSSMASIQRWFHDVDGFLVMIWLMVKPFFLRFGAAMFSCYCQCQPNRRVHIEWAIPISAHSSPMDFCPSSMASIQRWLHDIPMIFKGVEFFNALRLLNDNSSVKWLLSLVNRWLDKSVPASFLRATKGVEKFHAFKWLGYRSFSGHDLVGGEAIFLRFGADVLPLPTYP